MPVFTDVYRGLAENIKLRLIGQVFLDEQLTQKHSA
jgi:hypothetical protein